MRSAPTRSGPPGPTGRGRPSRRISIQASDRFVTDAERVRLVLVNLLTNARHAVEQLGTVTPPHSITLLTRSLPDGRVRIDVRDRGAGIRAEDLPRVFDPYFTTRRTGTGLGLPISRNIIEGLGGTIAVSSRPGNGTDVRIELPGSGA